jgi:dTMP kinase
MTGRFITFEGGEGAGKSTQIALIAGRIQSLGIDMQVTREPGGTTGAEAIRDLLVHGKVDRWSAVSEALLINAARADHVARVIRPALDAGRWVICDRYIDSTLAYQGIGKGVPRDDLLALHRLATGDLMPDVTIVLDARLEVAGDRLAVRKQREPDLGSRFEAHPDDFHRAIAEGFRAVAASFPDRCRLVDANGAIDAVSAAIWAAIAPLAGLPC